MAKKKKEVEREWGIIVDATVYVDDDYDADRAAEDDWYRANTSTSRYLNGIRLAPVNSDGKLVGYCDLTVKGPLEVGKSYWLVYTEYSTGDSFGHDENSRVEYHELYDSETKAKAALALLEAGDKIADDGKWTYSSKPKDKDDYWTTHILTNEGERLPVSKSWNGYFESLNGHRAEMFILGGESIV
jgi:hypothetical protein